MWWRLTEQCKNPSFFCFTLLKHISLSDICWGFFLWGKASGTDEANWHVEQLEVVLGKKEAVFGGMISLLGSTLAWTRKVKRYYTHIIKFSHTRFLQIILWHHNTFLMTDTSQKVVFVIYNFLIQYLVKFMLSNRLRELSKLGIY